MPWGGLGQYGSVKVRDAINRRLYKGLIIVKTAIYRVFVIYKFSFNLPYPNGIKGWGGVLAMCCILFSNWYNTC
jgi:hypothetical protein